MSQHAAIHKGPHSLSRLRVHDPICWFAGVALVLAFSQLSCSVDKQKQMPKASRGILDATEWNFAEDGPLKLAGQWEIYWQQLLSPKDFSLSGTTHDPGWISVPGTWKGQKVKGQRLPGHGYATLRLRVKLSPKQFIYGLKVNAIGTAYKLWSNETQIATNGQVGHDEKTTKAQTLPLLVFNQNASGEIKLVLQIANFQHRAGGVWGQLVLGSSKEMAKQWHQDIVLEMLPLGIFLVMSLYHLLLFVLRPKERSTLVFSLLCAVCALRIALMGERLLIYLFPAFNWQLAIKLEYLTVIFGALLPVMYIRQVFPRETSLRFVRVVELLSIGYTLLIALLPPKIFTQLLFLVQGYGVFCILFSVYVVILAVARRQQGADVLLTGVIFFFVAVVNDVCVTNEVYRAPLLIPFGVLALLLSQAALISMRFSKAFATVENLSTTLEQKVKDRTFDLQQAYQKLAEHDHLKSRFFANISHELRTPLTLILTPLERLLSSNRQRPQEEVQKLRSMGQNTQRLLRLVNQLLDFSRIESGAATLAFESINISEFIQPIIEGFIPFANNKGIKLDLEVQEGLPQVYVDPRMLDKVLCNLLSNACKFTPQGGAICISLSSSPTTYTISVKDTGIGISVENLANIFERFHQVDSSTSRKYEGSGIGLALSKELVELMGGTVTVKSEEGKGTEFDVSLLLGSDHIQNPEMIRQESSFEKTASRAPETVAALAAEVGCLPSLSAPSASDGASQFAEQSPPPVAEIRAHADSPKRESTQSERALVLVVEDNPDMRSLVKEICEEEFRVSEAADGREGLEQIEKQRPALVISDVMMPVMDGNELLKRIRGNPLTATIPVMLLTAKAGSEMKLEGLESGADDYLGKPFESRELLARARNLVRLQSTERQLRELNTKLQQEVVQQSAALERTRMLERYLPPDVAREVVQGNPTEALGQKQKFLTAFGLEMRGFEEIVAGVDAEEMVAMLNSYLSSMVELAFEHGATIDKFFRDTIFGYFGAPMSEGPAEDALRCAKMASKLQQAALEISERWQPLVGEITPTPTIILSSGQATVGNFGSSQRLEYTAVGEPLDEVRRLLFYAEEGDVLCSQSTQALIANHIDCQVVCEVDGRPSNRNEKLQEESKIKIYRLPGPLQKAPVRFKQQPPSEKRLNLGASSVQANLSTSDKEAAQSYLLEGYLKKGTLIADRFEVLRSMGQGGMGAVYLVLDQKLEIKVALKVLQPTLLDDSQMKARFYKEVKLARLVTHKNIARIYDLFEWSGIEFISMEYIHGKTLFDSLTTYGPFSFKDGINVMMAICRGLAAAHAAGVLHRDLKPSNIMLDKSGRVVILDFGIATTITSRNKVQAGDEKTIGHFAYSAPECFTAANFDQRADIYSLGIIAFELFTGQLPFKAQTLEEMSRLHIAQPPPNPQDQRPDLPPMLTAVIMRCLEKDPLNRFSSVAEIGALLKTERF